MIISLPPRHGKSRTASLFVEWVLGNDNRQKIMTGSYNELLSTTFAKSVRNSILEEKADTSKIVYSDIFPTTKIKRGDASMNLWSLEGGHNNYLATSPTGTSTGFGATLMLIDDIIKNSEEAHNENVKNKHWDWFVNTMLSRLEENGKIIIIMTRWSTDDLAGRALEFFKSQGEKVIEIKMKALVDPKKQEMLCPSILSYKNYILKTNAMGADIASANYQQEPIDLKGCLYETFKTYDSLPSHFSIKRAYCDTADTGSDYLCGIIYGVYEKEAYVLDVYYTKESMEITETEFAKRLFDFGVNIADIESNNGGRGFARSVGSILKNKYHSNKTVIKTFHQSHNKIARILSNSTWVMNHIYFPNDWNTRWSNYFQDMTKYQREGRNKHDDAPDATTGVAETIMSTSKVIKLYDKGVFGF